MTSQRVICCVVQGDEDSSMENNLLQCSSRCAVWCKDHKVMWFKYHKGYYNVQKLHQDLVSYLADASYL